MKIWFAKGTIGIAVVIAAREAGIDAELIEIDFAAKEQTQAAYLDINPKGRVPAVASDQGLLTETGAILEFIAGLVPEKRLMPADPWAAAQLRSALHYFASTMHVNHAHRMRGYRWASEDSSFADMAANVPRTMGESAAFVETELLQGPWVMGDDFTIADIHLFMLTSWLEGDGVDVTDYPRLAAHFSAMQKRPAVAWALAQGYLPYMQP